MTDVEPSSSGSRRLAAMVAGTVLLTAGAALLGTLGWAVPTRTIFGWQVTDVPADLLAVLIATAVACAALADLLTRPGQLDGGVAATWWGTAAAAAFPWFGTTSTTPRWALTAASSRCSTGCAPARPPCSWGWSPGSSAGTGHRRATVGVAVLTLPMFALGWALTASADAGMAVAVPLAVAVFLTRAGRPEGSPSAWAEYGRQG